MLPMKEVPWHFMEIGSVYIANNTNVTLLNNTAENVGGAIFVRNPLPYAMSPIPASFSCIFMLPPSVMDVTVYFYNAI